MSLLERAIDSPIAGAAFEDEISAQVGLESFRRLYVLLLIVHLSFFSEFWYLADKISCWMVSFFFFFFLDLLPSSELYFNDIYNSY